MALRYLDIDMALKLNQMPNKVNFQQITILANRHAYFNSYSSVEMCQ